MSVAKIPKNADVFIHTMQSSAIKILFDCLKETLIENNLNFSTDGIKVISNNTTKSVTVFLFLKAKGFEESGTFCCKKNVKVGINTAHFFKIIKKLETKDDILDIVIYENNPDKIFIKISNAIKNNCSVVEYPTLCIEDDVLSDNSSQKFIENLEKNCDVVVTIPAIQIQKTIKYLKEFSTEVQIMCVDKTLSFGCSADEISNLQIKESFGDPSEGFSIVKNTDIPIIEAKYKNKHLLQFTKCTSFGQNSPVQLFFSHGKPLVLSFKVGNLGELKFCVAQLVGDQN